MSLCSLSGIFPAFWLLLLPLFGCFYGKEPVLYLSLMLCLLAVVTSLVGRIQILSEPLIQLATVALLFLLPINLVPYPLVWLYDKLLWLSEPGLQIVEVLGIVQLSLRLGQMLVEFMEDQPNLAKSAILTVSGLSYVGSIQLAYDLWNSGTLVQQGVLVSVLILMAVLLVFTLKLDSGVISDAALATLFSLALISTMQQDLSSQHELQLPADWQIVADRISPLKMLTRILTSSFGSASHTWAFLGKACTVWFICSAAMRIASIFYSLALLQALLDQEESSDEYLYDDGDDDDQHHVSYSHWQSLTLIRIVLIFAYTQFLVHHLHASFHSSGTFLHVWTQFCSYGRLGQVVLLFVLMVYKLYKREELEEVDSW